MFFAILYLRGAALDYFELFINEPDLYQCLNFLEDWSTFVQKLSNVFGLYSPEDCHKPPLWLSPFLLFFSFKISFLFIAWETHVTLCDRMRDNVTSEVTSHDMSHIIWLGVRDNKCTDQVDYV